MNCPICRKEYADKRCKEWYTTYIHGQRTGKKFKIYKTCMAPDKKKLNIKCKSSIGVPTAYDGGVGGNYHQIKGNGKMY
jgi:hypothetical protein